ncbi:hypothetical protein [Desulfovibrio ferrophilus]|nr:hypothetical protein [Desulfovibrio ferrophilus]
MIVMQMAPRGQAGGACAPALDCRRVVLTRHDGDIKHGGPRLRAAIV